MILVTGATGTVGSEAVKLLSEKGFNFRALAHSPEKAEIISGPGVEITYGQYDDTESLDKAMQGVEKVFLICPSGPKQVEFEANVLNSAKFAGVRHIVKLSVLGASPFSPINLGRWHWYSEKNIEESGLLYTHVRPTLFMQNFLRFTSTIASEGKFYAPAGDGKASLIDARDIAEVAVAALTEHGHDNRIYEITGPEAISYKDAAESLSTAIGRKVTYVETTPEDTKNQLAGMGYPEWLINDSLYYYEYGRTGEEETVTHWVGKITGKQPHMFSAFACDYAAEFQQK